MYVGKISEAADELYAAMQRLVPQLGQHKVPPTREELTALLNTEGATLLIARYPDEDGQIVGMLSLTIYRVPTGTRAIVEDIVVDQEARRKGIGEALVRHAIELAREAGASGVSLTSNPEREAANRLYLSLGFELRKTNPYFYKFE
jgi:ribosomal protein S18 acetylase RimI-like enzyme